MAGILTGKSPQKPGLSINSLFHGDTSEALSINTAVAAQIEWPKETAKWAINPSSVLSHKFVFDTITRKTIIRNATFTFDYPKTSTLSGELAGYSVFFYKRTNNSLATVILGEITALVNNGIVAS